MWSSLLIVSLALLSSLSVVYGVIIPSDHNKLLYKKLLKHIIDDQADYKNMGNAHSIDMRQQMEYVTSLSRRIVRNMIEEYFTTGFTEEPASDAPLARFPDGVDFYALGVGSFGRNEVVGSSDLDVMYVAIVSGVDAGNTRQTATQRIMNALSLQALPDYWFALKADAEHAGAGLSLDAAPGSHVFTSHAAFYASIKAYRETGNSLSVPDAIKNTRVSMLLNSIPLYVSGADANYVALYTGFVASLSVENLKTRFNSNIRQHLPHDMVTTAYQSTSAFSPKSNLLRGVTLPIESYYLLRWKVNQPKTRLATSTFDRLYQLASWGDIDLAEAVRGENLLLVAAKWEVAANIIVASSGSWGSRTYTYTLQHGQAPEIAWRRSNRARIRAQLEHVKAFGTHLRSEFARIYRV